MSKLPPLVAILAVGLTVWSACAPAATPTQAPTQAPTRAATATPALASPTATPAGALVRPTPTPSAAPTATGSQPKYGGTVTYRVSDDPLKRINIGGMGPAWPGEASSTLTNNAFSTVARRVAVPAPNRRPGEGLCGTELAPEAGSWKWTNDTTLEIKLVPNLRYANRPPVNGRLATVKDIVFSYERNKVVSNVMFHLKAIKEMAAVDDTTLRIRFEKPWPAFIESVMASHYGTVVLPPEAVGPDGNLPAAGLVGTGPFYLESWVPGVSYQMARNDNYFKKGLPHVDRLKGLVVEDWATVTALLVAGKLDVVMRGFPAVQTKVLQKAGVSTTFCPPGGVWGAYFRTTAPPFDDVRVRRAFSMSFDREGLIKGVLSGAGFPISYMVPAQELFLPLEAYPPEVRKYSEYHPDEAKRLLVEAGQARGVDVTFYMSTGEVGWPMVQLLEGIMEQAKDVGFRTKIQNVERGRYTASSADGSWTGDMVMGASTIDPYRSLVDLHSSNAPKPNMGFVKDAELDALIDKFAIALEPAQAKDLARRIQLRSMDQAYLIRIPANYDYAANQPWIKGFSHIGTLQAMNANLWSEVLWIEK